MRTVRLQSTAASVAAGLFFMAACAPVPPQAEAVHVAELEGNRSDVSFVANFERSHALGRAQSLQNVGRAAEAESLVVETLRNDSALRGLCFERFTLGGTDIVLSVCAPDSSQERSAMQVHWLEILGAQRGIIYVEANEIAQPELSMASGR